MAIDTSNFNFQGVGVVDDAGIPGCTNPIAGNFNPLATIDDGSCVYLNYTHIPDANFRAKLEADYGAGVGNPFTWYNDTIASEHVLTSEISGMTSLDVSSSSISDLTGIEDFIALTYLNCYANQLTTLDISGCTALDELLCGVNQLTSLDVSNNTALTILHPFANPLTSLDVSNNTYLTHLGCYNNQLTSLDVSNNTALDTLECGSNQLTSLDVSANTALTYLGCAWNQLTSLDVRNNITLTDLYCHNNQLTSLDVRNGNNVNFINFETTANSGLTCISVDDVNLDGTGSWQIANWTSSSFQFDVQHVFSDDCGYVYGCTDPNAVNYNSAFDFDDGSCTYEGCMDATACNYNVLVTIDDGSCILPDGCVDPTACNYNPNALCDDGSCILPDGCTDPLACNYDSLATCDDGSCIGLLGCIDPTACNYDASATCDDGTCILPDGCTDSIATNYDPAATCDDGSCTYATVNGCTDPAATNYDPSATVDDGSCTYAVNGCTDPLANNYNPNATIDSGSCTYYTFGPELLINGSFSNPTGNVPAGWVLGGSIYGMGGNLNVFGGATAYTWPPGSPNPGINSALVTGSTYRLTVDVISGNPNHLHIYSTLGYGIGIDRLAHVSGIQYEAVFVWDPPSAWFGNHFYIDFFQNSSVTVDNMSLKEVI